MGIFGKSEERQEDETLADLRGKVSEAGLPPHVQKIADKELGMLSKMGPSAAEYTIGLNYIQYLISLPWNKKTEDSLDLSRAERILNERHYGLHEAKKRVLEHLAVKILVKNRKPRILVVDDEKIVLRNLEHLFNKEGYAVDTAQNGVEALGKIDTADYDVVMTDLKMEGVSGIHVLEKAKSRYPDTQVIMITGYASIDTAVESMKKGAFHYIAKPFKLEDVRSVVSNALERKTSRRSAKGSVLCFAGPPGTGKTSIGRSIADALGRKFARISLAGIRDEAEIRGHRKTYAGAMPGRIIEEIRRTESSNPVLMLDEADKIGQEFRGDPASALLEVLDPEQNRNFLDHYVDASFDLSGVMFIVTANVTENMHEALRDRMEIIDFSGYTEKEKAEIALNYLVPRQVHEKGLSDYPPEFMDEAVVKIIHEYTREAGIRDLERQIAAVCRKIATDFVQQGERVKKIQVTPELVEKCLGPRKYYFEIAGEKNRVGVTTGLVWTDVGGDIIFIEAAKMKGSGKLMLTGSLGNVMRESAQTALSYIRSNCGAFGIADDFFELQDVHVHVPAGAIPKDGPSAGATIAVALISMLTGRQAKRDVAISGEITLSGRVLPVGGIKEKLLAARRAGVRHVVLSEKNRVDVENLSQDVRSELEVHYVENIEEIVETVLLR